MSFRELLTEMSQHKHKYTKEDYAIIFKFIKDCKDEDVKKVLEKVLEHMNDELKKGI